jgi:hydrogenase expression/formation protein HypD
MGAGAHLLQSRLRDGELARRILRGIRDLGVRATIMHVCGTHQDTIMRFGLDALLRECGIRIISGPGCPVCVTTQREYEEAGLLMERGKIIATFGDAAKVRGPRGSLLDRRAEGGDIRIVYGIRDAAEISRRLKREVVFLAIGFETTAPGTASLLLSDPPEGFSILCCHRYIPPVLDALLGMGEIGIQGFIQPGHVSTIIGVKPYECISSKYGIPQVIAGFEPLDVLAAVYMLAKQIRDGRAEVENEYTRAVRYEGNPRALEAMERVFEPIDVPWRGFPIVPRSGMALRRGFEAYDARKVYEDELSDMAGAEISEDPNCRCGEVLRGVAEPSDCPLFGRACTPAHPRGPCMVSIEGACFISYRYGSHQPRKAEIGGGAS